MILKESDISTLLKSANRKVTNVNVDGEKFYEALMNKSEPNIRATIITKDFYRTDNIISYTDNTLEIISLMAIINNKGLSNQEYIDELTNETRVTEVFARHYKIREQILAIVQDKNMMNFVNNSTSEYSLLGKITRGYQANSRWRIRSILPWILIPGYEGNIDIDKWENNHPIHNQKNTAFSGSAKYK